MHISAQQRMLSRGRWYLLTVFPIIGLWLTACVPELGEVSALLDDRDHDFDGDEFTENQGDCDDNNAEATPDTAWWGDRDGDGQLAWLIMLCSMGPRAGHEDTMHH